MILRLPALAEEDDPLGRVVGEPLWPERFSSKDYEDKRANTFARDFSALYLRGLCRTRASFSQLI